MEKKDKTLNVPNLRFPEFSGEWERCKVKDFTKVVAGATPSTSNKEYCVKGKVDFPQIGFEKGTTERGVSKVSKSC